MKSEKEVLRDSMQIISKAIDILHKAILPQGMTDNEAICELYGIFDSPECITLLSDAKEIFTLPESKQVPTNG